jgi:hypothetical protein
MTQLRQEGYAGQARDEIKKQIASAKRRGFKTGDCYWRGATLMVEITPGNFVNEAKAKEFGVKPRDDVEFAR